MGNKYLNNKLGEFRDHVIDSIKWGRLAYIAFIFLVSGAFYLIMKNK